MTAAGAPGQPLRLGVLVSHPIQYFAPVHRALARMPGVALTVLFRTRMGLNEYHDAEFDRALRWDVPLLDGYPHVFMSPKRDLSGVEPVVVRELLRRRFDALVVHGYNSATSLLAAVTARACGTVALLRGDTRLSARHADAPAWRLAAKRRILSLFDGCLCAGAANRRYYEAYGVPAARLYDVPLCVDNDYFRLPEPDRAGVRAQWRGGRGIPEDAVVFAFAAKMIPRKRPHDLLAAFGAIADRWPGAWLVLAGSGPEEASLRDAARAAGTPRLLLPGFLNQSQVRELFAACDCMVLPSGDEPFGLVVNEAMAAGLPVIVSDEVGAAEDLVRGRETGVVVRCGDHGELAAALELVLRDPELRLRLAANARRVIDEWSVPVCAQRTVDAARRAVASRRG